MFRIPGGRPFWIACLHNTPPSPVAFAMPAFSLSTHACRPGPAPHGQAIRSSRNYARGFPHRDAPPAACNALCCSTGGSFLHDGIPPDPPLRIKLPRLRSWVHDDTTAHPRLSPEVSARTPPICSCSKPRPLRLVASAMNSQSSPAWSAFRPSIPIASMSQAPSHPCDRPSARPMQ